MIHVGFTGTRLGLSDAQRRTIITFLQDLGGDAILRVHHGDCIGADAEFHEIVRMLPRTRIVKHPGPLGKFSAGCEADETREPKPNMPRNRDIVAASHVMIGAPYENEPQPRGGTWATIQMARAALKRGEMRALYVVGREGQLLDHGEWK